MPTATEKGYMVGKFVLNPTIAKTVTTREGQTRADASTYLCAELPNDCEIEADENGYPTPKRGPKEKAR